MHNFMQLQRVVNLSRKTQLLLNRHHIWYTPINNLNETNFISLQINGQKELAQNNGVCFGATITKRCEFCSSSRSSAQNVAQTPEISSNSDPADIFAATAGEKSISNGFNTHGQVPAKFANIIREERDNLPLKIRDLRRQTIAAEGYIQLRISFISANIILLSFTRVTI